MILTKSGVGISDAARETGLTVHTLRYYERIGLIPVLVRGVDGRRRYSSHDLDWINLLTRLRTTGMSVADMIRYADLVRQGPHTAAARRELLELHREQVTARLEQIRRDLAVIDAKIGTYEQMEQS